MIALTNTWSKDWQLLNRMSETQNALSPAEKDRIRYEFMTPKVTVLLTLEQSEEDLDDYHYLVQYFADNTSGQITEEAIITDWEHAYKRFKSLVSDALGYTSYTIPEDPMSKNIQ